MQLTNQTMPGHWWVISPLMDRPVSLWFGTEAGPWLVVIPLLCLTNVSHRRGVNFQWAVNYLHLYWLFWEVFAQRKGPSSRNLGWSLGMFYLTFLTQICLYTSLGPPTWIYQKQSRKTGRNMLCHTMLFQGKPLDGNGCSWKFDLQNSWNFTH